MMQRAQSVTYRSRELRQEWQSLLVGSAPLRCTNRRLRFELKSRILWSFRLRAVSILGGQPLLVPDTELHNQLFASVLAAAPECDAIYLHSVPTDSFCWSY